MLKMSDASDASEALKAPKKDEHYLAAVTDLGDSEEIAASEDIYSDSGVLLLSKGSRISSNVFSTLSRHRLEKEVDNTLAIGEAITNAQLFQELRQELDRFPTFKRLMRAVPNPVKLEDHLRHIYLDEMMRNKLTVAHKSFPTLFAHSLRVAIGAAMVGIFCGMSDEQCEHLATAGLFHDLGDMHLDPELFDPDRTLGPEEKRGIYAHPLVMFNLLKQSDAYHPHISVPVLEHHERLNGSGYPQRKAGYSNKLCAVLAVVEVVISMRERYSAKRVWMVLMSQADLYDRDVIQAITRALRQTALDEEAESPGDDSLSESVLETLRYVVKQWNEVRACLDLENITELQRQLLERMQGVEQMLVRGGISLDIPEPLALFAQDKPALAEANHLLSETLYSVRELYLEVARNFDGKALYAAGDAVGGWLEQVGIRVYDYEQRLRKLEFDAAI